ncbi:MAG: hypothetical protein IKA23_03020 [Akkermansia sp.]|nr:hypothetical protein [Akkermansia sp.]
MNTEETYLNAPHTSLAHLGCAGLVCLAALSGHISLLSGDFHLWLLTHPYTMPLLFLGALAAAYLLEHSLTTIAMLTLLLVSAIGAGLAMAGFIPPDEGGALLWQLMAGPVGYFATVALAQHFWAGKLYRWQLCCIVTAGALLLPWLLCPLTGAHPVTTLCALGVGLTTAVVELCVFFGRDYFEITSTSRTRSTVIGMVMLLAVPIYKMIWISLCGCYRGGSGILRIFRWWW